MEITIFFSEREPVGPHRLTVPARRTRHVRFNDLEEPEAIPRGTDYASILLRTCRSSSSTPGSTPGSGRTR